MLFILKYIINTINMSYLLKINKVNKNAQTHNCIRRYTQKIQKTS